MFCAPAGGSSVARSSRAEETVTPSVGESADRGGAAASTTRAPNSDAAADCVAVFPSGCRVVFADLEAGETGALQAQLTRRIRVIAVSMPLPRGAFWPGLPLRAPPRLMALFDESGRLAIMNASRGVTLHKMKMKDKVAAAAFQWHVPRSSAAEAVPPRLLLAVTVGRLVQIWDCTDLCGGRPSLAPMRLVRTFGHASATITALAFRTDAAWLAAGGKGLNIRVYAVVPDIGADEEDARALKTYKPPMLSGHRESIVGIFWYGDTQLITAAGDGAAFVWKFTPVDVDDDENAREGDGASEDNDENDEEEDTDMDDDDIAGNDDERSGGDSPRRKRRRRRRDSDGDGTLALTANGTNGKSQSAKRANQRISLFDGFWKLQKKFYMSMPGKLTAVDFHEATGILLTGFSHGVFTLHTLPDFDNIHRLSISSSAVTAAQFNARGNWIAMGCARLGQMIVWDWKAESYVHRQQGHDFEVSSIDFTPDGSTLVSGGEDGKVKLWGVSSGANYATLADHSAPVTAVAAAKSGGVVLSASRDGTVRAYDLVRYRQFRIFTTPTPAQLVSLAVDPAGELVVAGSGDSFEVFVWSMRTGKLLDVVSGHEGPIGCLAFVPSGAPILATGSWDHNVKIWNFSAKDSAAIDTFVHTTDVLSVAFSPSGKLLAVSTLDGCIAFWDMDEASQVGTIEGRRDIAAGRYAAGDLRSAANVAAGNCFMSVAFSADGSSLFAAGKSKYVCLYDVEDRVLLQRFQLSQNTSLDGVLDMRDSRRMTAAGIPLDEIDDEDEDDDFARRAKGGIAGTAAAASLLPGTASGKAVINCRALSIAHGDRCWAAATPEGIIMYAHDAGLRFDPLDLAEDVTPATIKLALGASQFGKAVAMSLRLGEADLIERCLFAAPKDKIASIAEDIPGSRLNRLLTVLAGLLETSPHVELAMRWIQAVLAAHGLELTNTSAADFGLSTSSSLRPVLRRLSRGVAGLESRLAASMESCSYKLKFLASQKKATPPLESNDSLPLPPSS